MDSETARRFQALERRLQRLETKPAPLYVVGSFAPTLVGSTTPGTFTYTANATIVEWTRLANRVHFNGRIVITVITVAPVGNMTIAGLPYVGVSDPNMAIAGGAAFLGWRGITMPAGYTQVAAQIGNGVATMLLTRQASAAAIAAVQGADIALVAGSLDFRFEGQYRVA